MLTLAQVKFERLKAQTERDILINELMKGTLVRWQDVLLVLGEKVVTARNKIMALPSRYADRFTREEMDEFRKALYGVLTEISKIGLEDVQAKDKSMDKYRSALTKPTAEKNTDTTTYKPK